MSFIGTPQRVAAYEEMWRREESELWTWLEDRVGMEKVREVGKMTVEAKTMEDRLKDEKMEEREMEVAIRITEDRLRVLKNTVEKKREAVLGEGTKAPAGEGRKDEV